MAVAIAGCTGTAIAGGQWLVDTAGDLPSADQHQVAPGPTGDLEQVNAYPNTRTGVGAVTVTGNHVISAVAGDRATEVVSLPDTDGPPRWTKTVPMEPSEIRLTAVDNLIIIDGQRSLLDDGRDIRAVLSATDGKLLWKREWENRTDVIVEIRTGIDKHAIARVDLRTGEQEWSRSGTPEVLSADDHRAEPMRQWPATDTSPPATLPAVNGTLTDETTATATTIVELDSAKNRGNLLDPRNGKVRGSGSLPLDADLWVAYDNLVIGKTTTPPGAGQTLAGYAVPGFRRNWTVPLAANERIERVKPCGPQLVCVAVTGRDANHTLAVNTRTGTETWRTAVDNSDEDWYAHGETIVRGKATFLYAVDNPRLLNQNDGRERRPLPEYSSVLAANDGRMVLHTVEGTSLRWQLHVEDMATSRATGAVSVGDKPPEQVAVAGNLVGVLTGDRRTLAFTISGLD